MLKCCAFGTVRIDIHAFQDINELDHHEEIKIHEMSMKVGGSVCNTISVLNAMKMDAVLYMLNSCDDFADFVKIKLHKRKIDYIVCKQDQNETATSLIFVEDTGKKKIISYDGVRQDRYILSKLARDIDQFDLFYTSFYEINPENYQCIIEVLSKSALNFVDLSPLIYEIDPKIVKAVLEKVQILTGTRDEYDILLRNLGLNSCQELIETYDIAYVFVKKGSEGAALYKGDAVYEYQPAEKRDSRDTTGCGDTFSAGVIRGLSENRPDREILRMAVDMASRVAYEGFDPALFAEEKE